jgi:hypothetical protein
MSTEIDRSAGLSASTAIKGPVLVATTGNVTLSGEQTIDGVACVDGDRVLVRAQTSSAQNGIYLVSTGVWSRSKDFSRNNDVHNGTMVYVAYGSTLAGKIYAVSSPDAEIEIDTSTITLVLIFTAGLGSGDMLAANNLSDVSNVATARTNLGAAPLDSPTFTTLARAPTESTAENSTKIATTAFVQALVAQAISNLGLGAAAQLAVATAADIWAGTSATKVITPDIMQAALADVALVDGATITVNFAVGINFALASIAGNRALAASGITADIVGRSGKITITQDGTGSRTLSTSGTPWKNVNSQNLVLSTAASAKDVIYYQILSTTEVLLSLGRAIG